MKLYITEFEPKTLNKKERVKQNVTISFIKIGHIVKFIIY